MERGVIISPYFTFDGQSLHFPGLAGIEKEHLRHYLLYWDKIEYPNNNLIHIASSSEDQFLIDAGIMQRTNINLGGFSGNIGTAYILAQSIATRQLNEVEPGKWTIAQSGPRLYLPYEVSKPVKSLEIELYNALPTPGPDVSLENILAFKERYRDELIAFRAYVNELYLEISKSGDIPRAKTVVIQRLEKSINDLDRSARNLWTSKLVSGFKVELNLPTILEKAIEGALVAKWMGLPLTLGGIVGAATATLKFNIGLAPKVDGTPKDFAYLSHVKKELRTSQPT
jgi:hypothetical protein